MTYRPNPGARSFSSRTLGPSYVKDVRGLPERVLVVGGETALERLRPRDVAVLGRPVVSPLPGEIVVWWPPVDAPQRAVPLLDGRYVLAGPGGGERLARAWFGEREAI